jgi:hypothetical protein
MSASRRDGFHRTKVAAWAGLFLVLASLPVAFARADEAPITPPALAEFIPVPCDPSFLGMSDLPEDLGSIVGPAENLTGGGL